MASYVWGSQPPISISVTDDIYHAPGSTAYSGTVTVSGSFGSDHTWTYDYWIDVTVNGTTKRLKANTSGSITWSNTVTFDISGNTTASSIYLDVVVSTQSPYRNSLDASYTTNIGSYSPPVTEPASVPTLSTYSAKLGSSITIYTNRRSSSYTHTLSYAVGTKTGTIGTGVTTSSAWTVPTTLIDDVTSTGTTCVITCTTYYGGSIVGANTVTLTLFPPDDAIPTVSAGWFSVARDNQESAAQNITEWVNGYSRAVFTFDPSKVSAKYGATIASFSITYNGDVTYATNNVAKSPILVSDFAFITCTVTDSRGFEKSEQYRITLLTYSPPTIGGITVFRSDSQKVETEDGHYICARATARCTSLNGKNSVTLKGAYKLSSAGSFGTPVNMQNDTPILLNSTQISENYSYTIQLTATDSLGVSSTYEVQISTKSVSFSIKDGGNGAAFGKLAETDNLLDVQWDMNVHGNFTASNIDDFVVKIGHETVGNIDWTYRKWESGIAECWGSWIGQLDSYQGSLLRSVYATYVSFPTDLFPYFYYFYSSSAPSPAVFFTAFGPEQEMTIPRNTTVPTYVGCYLQAESTGTGRQRIRFDVHAIGRWK